MDYKKLHEETLAALQKMVFDGKITEETARRICSDFIKGSKDEKIRKALIQLVRMVDKNHIHQIFGYGDIKYSDMIAWLEKQGEKIDTIENFDTEFEKQVSCLIASVINREHEYNQGYVKWTANALLEYAKHELEKQGEHKSQGKSALEVWKDMRLEVYQQASGNRHEPNYSNDSTKMFSLTDIDEIFEKIAEKQGEQKSADKKYTFKAIPRLLDMIQPTDRAKSYCQKLIDSLIQEGYCADAKIVDNCLKQMNGEKVAMATMDEQKPTEWSE